jgi:hypothetical protein
MAHVPEDEMARYEQTMKDGAQVWRAGIELRNELKEAKRVKKASGKKRIRRTKLVGVGDGTTTITKLTKTASKKKVWDTSALINCLNKFLLL